MLFAYLGPDTVLPLTSVIAAIAGGVMMFGRGIVAKGRRILGRVTGRSLPAAGPSRRSEVLGRRQGPAAGAPHVRAGQARESQPSNAS